MKFRLLLLLGCSLLATALVAQDAKTYKKLGEQYYAAAKYREALDALLVYQEAKPGDEEIMDKLGICYYFTNNLSKAKEFLTHVIENERKPAPKTYFYLGRTFQAENKFEEAIKQYKAFLRLIDEDDINRPLVKDAIRRCSYGMRVQYDKAPVIVENMGKNVNSIGDDFRPILSPNYPDKIYFSSIRAGNLGGLRNKEGKEDQQNGQFSSDMYSTEIINGEWTATQPMSFLLNSARHDVILDFSEKGDRMYFYKGYTLFAGDMLVDTFKRIEERELFGNEFKSPIEMWKSDAAPQFFNDTILLFASRRAGGYGGLDLYITTNSDGVWSVPQNLGPTINSPYDETTPFLAKDGRTLFFSSNNAEKSIGGMDIFMSVYRDRTETWDAPSNLKMPVNSSGDDQEFRLSKDGFKAYFSSSRKTGFGKNDLYIGYYREFQESMGRYSDPIVFSEVTPLKKLQEELANAANENGDATAPIFPVEEIKEYTLKPIYYNSDGNVLTGPNLKMLNTLAQLMAENEDLKLVLTANSDGTDPAEFDLYFSIKKAEKAGEYLVQNNIDGARIMLRGVGSAYPIAKNEVNGKENVIGQRLNRRVDIMVLGLKGLPIKINYETAKVSEQMGTISGKFFKNSSKDLSYKVQIGEQSQMYRGDLIFKYPNAMVERRADQSKYLYTVGLYQKFRSAGQLQDDINKSGTTEAFVVPYVDGMRLNIDESLQWQEAYPDLSNFLDKQ